MDAHSVGARRPRPATTFADAARLLLFGLTLAPAAALHAAGYRTANFTIDAPTPQLAQEIGETAEHWRHDLAMEWLGAEMPAWSRPCPIKATVAPNLGAGGATSFVFDHGEVFDWRMNIQGSRERILDSVLPHEITHTIFASFFRQPLPRWADEGACTTVEDRSEVSKMERMLMDILHTGHGIPFSNMFAMKEYPSDVMPLYAQGHALSEYLIGQHGKRAFLAFLADGMKDENWPRAVEEHYGYQHLLALQNSWLDWVRAGRPALVPTDEVLAVAAAPEPPHGPFPAPRREAVSASPVIHNQESAAHPATAISPVPASQASSATDATDWTAVDGKIPAQQVGAVYDASKGNGVMWR